MQHFLMYRYSETSVENGSRIRVTTNGRAFCFQWDLSTISGTKQEWEANTSTRPPFPATNLSQFTRALSPPEHVCTAAEFPRGWATFFPNSRAYRWSITDSVVPPVLGTLMKRMSGRTADFAVSVSCVSSLASLVGGDDAFPPFFTSRPSSSC